VAEDGKDCVDGGGNGSDVVKKILLPAAAGVGAVAAGYAAKKAPDLVCEQLVPKLEDEASDEAAGIGKQAMEKMKPQSGLMGKLAGSMPGVGGSGDGNGGGKKTRRLPIQRWTDVAVPVEKAYEAWSDFDKFPSYMHRVLTVEKAGRDRVKWHEKIWFSKREWEARITDRRKNDRIAWKTKSGTEHSGVVSFHKIGDNLTRVMVIVDFQPTGMMEKLASGLRFTKRTVQADLARFKAYVEFDDAKRLDYGHESSGESKNGSASRNNGGSQSGRQGERARNQRAERRQERRA
jgi:uncharacterized membrane protein